MKNNFNLITLFGLILFSIGILFVGVVTQETYSNMSWTGELNWNWGLTLATSIGLAYLLLGFGLMLRRSWARGPSVILLIISGLGWIVLLVAMGNTGNKQLITNICITLVLYSGLGFGIIFLSNKQIIKQFEGEDFALEEERNDILDS